MGYTAYRLHCIQCCLRRPDQIMKRFALFIFAMFIAAACQPETSLRSTAFPFPTMTIGQTLRGYLTPVSAQPISPILSNPATAEALANRPTPTPNTTVCPMPREDVELPRKPDTLPEANAALLGFLDAGGSVTALEDALRIEWQAVPETGYVRQHDLTGAGSSDLVIGYTAPEGNGALVVFGCADGRAVQRYEVTSESTTPPQLVWVGDINRSFIADIVFTREICEEADACEIETQIVEYQRRSGRFVNLLDAPVITLDTPSVNDIDGDEVSELVMSLQSRGNSVTGPMRTGVNIYDWNGTAYTLSIIQLDPPRYRIQLVHEADRLFSQLDMANALALYQQALDSPDLRLWYNDEEAILGSYILYREVLAYAYLQDPRLSDVITQLNLRFATSDSNSLVTFPAYVEMAYVFLNNVETTRDLNAACAAVQEVIERRPNAIALMNRYGNRSPVYAALDLCPY
jgi:hypothetical protein